jgi:beta-lactamase regulating signal transducer with metallopeptidase domain
MFIVWIVAFMVHSTVLLGLAWLVSRALEGRPRATAALWRAALVAPLVTATLQLWVQPDTAWRWSLTEQAVARVESGLAPAPDALAWAIEPPSYDFELAAAMEDDEEPVLATPAAVLEVAPSEEPPSPPWTWSELLGALWLLGALLGLAGIVAGALRLRSQLVGRRPFAAPWPSHALGPAPRIELCVAPNLRAPLVYGVWRPEVCVPSRALVELDEDSLRAIVAHELGHVVHRDPLWRWIGLVLERVFFFQPLLRLGNRELTAASELLADAWAVGRTRHPLALAESLTVVAAWVQARALPSPAPAMAGQRSQLWRRVERLVDQDAAGRVDPWPRWLAPGLAVAVAGLVAFAPGVSANAMCPRVVSGFEFDPETHAAVLAAGHAEGPTVIVLQNEPEVVDDHAPDAKDDRKAARATAKERRKAKKRVKQVFKKAR